MVGKIAFILAFPIRTAPSLITMPFGMNIIQILDEQGVEIDVFISSIGVGIEYDGVYYHHDKMENDIAKNDLLEGLGFKLIRMREEPLEQI